ncbi:serine/threonine-protein phosphatase Pgam5, mitochondrial [Drosophila eugracilis]|uniref:serine/threonine-protein phosphatase Pgam5, mitochondrial n=1 Tax=Drosophila eugracilis TaxID=29029 RepID=UPI001BDB46FC|nr:serine/threonine-protein phosphatase Pgam5, mitochondrial [Drosophila eugracilis]
MKYSAVWRSVGAMSCGSLVTYLTIRLFEGQNSTYSNGAEGDGRRETEPLANGSWMHHWDLHKPQLQKVANGEMSSALRHIILVRHGEYTKTLDGSHLTELGRRQAELTGRRLREMDLTWDHVVASTMPRAEETAMIILKQLNLDPLKMKRCTLLPEGTPYPGDPPPKRSARSLEQAYQRDGPRIEAAFRRYFFRASPEQEHDSYLLIVGHSNVIRYLILRALQLPPAAWTRLNLNHGSITWLTVWPTGYVTLRCLGDSGFMPVSELTNRRPLSTKSSNK